MTNIDPVHAQHVMTQQGGCPKCFPSTPTIGVLDRTPQMERPAQLRYLRMGIHDHHVAARRPTDARLPEAWEHYDDERCYWDGGAA